MANTIFPNKIILLGEVYKIKEVSKNDLTCNECGEECMGQIKWEQKTIYVSTDEPENSAEKILFHELGHYFGDYYEISKSEAFAEGFGKFLQLIITQLGYKRDERS